MINMINDIEKAMDAGAYLSALALALTIPDIMGKVEFGGIGSKARYTKWFDKYVDHLYSLDHPDIEDSRKRKVTSYICYQLRCAFLHSGSNEINDARDKLEVVKINEVKLIISEDNESYLADRCQFDTYGNIIDLEIDIRVLCYVLCWAARDHYYSVEDKSIFESAVLPIKIYP